MAAASRPSSYTFTDPIKSNDRYSDEVRNRLMLRPGDKVFAESGIRLRGTTYAIVSEGQGGIELVATQVNAQFRQQPGRSVWEFFTDRQHGRISAYPEHYFEESLKSGCEPTFTHGATYLLPIDERPTKHLLGGRSYVTRVGTGPTIRANGAISTSTGAVTFYEGATLYAESATFVPIDTTNLHITLDARTANYWGERWLPMSILRPDGTLTDVRAKAWDFPSRQKAQIAFSFGSGKGLRGEEGAGVIDVVKRPKIELRMPKSLTC